jgi:hypothetical protein
MAKQTYDLKINVDAPSIAQLEQQLESVNSELKDLDRNSDAFKTASKDAQALTTQLEKANREIAGFKLEDKLQAADGAIKVFAGSLQGVVGTLGLIGVESEVFGEFEEKAASAIAVGMGIKDVSEGFGQFTNVMKTSGVAAKLFGNTTRIALTATGVGAFVVALGAIVAYWDEITVGVQKAAKSFPFVGKAIEAVQNTFNSFIERFRPFLERLGLMQTEEEKLAQQTRTNAQTNAEAYERELELLKAKGSSQEELHKKEMEIFDERIKAAEDEEEKKQLIHEKEIARLEEETRKRIEENQKRLQAQKDSDAAFLEQLKEQREAEYTLEEELKAAFDAMMADKEEEKDELAEFDFIDINDLEDDPELVASLERNDRLVEGEKDKQARLKEARAQGLANIIAIAGAEGDVGKAAFIAQQLLAAREMVLDAKKTIAFSKAKLAESQAAVAAGQAKTLAAGFPQNVPLLIAYAAQAAGIISAIRSATKASAGSFIPGTTPTTVVTSPASQGTNLQQQPTAPQGPEKEPIIKTYVLSGDVRRGQEAESKINNRRRIG